MLSSGADRPRSPAGLEALELSGFQAQLAYMAAHGDSVRLGTVRVDQRHTILRC